MPEKKDRLKIALLVDWHSDKMGYSDNFLPKALAKLGHEVHLVTSNAQVYFNSPLYKDTFESFLGPGIQKCGMYQTDGYTVHRLPIMQWRGRMRTKGLLQQVRALKPDIVQSGEFRSFQTYEAALARPVLGYKFFSECHTHASVFPAAKGQGGRRAKVFWPVYSATLGRLINLSLEKCFPISVDSADIVKRFYGIDENKVEVRSLGVDTDLFRPVFDDESLKKERAESRRKLGFRDDEVVAIYTGRISVEKDPIYLAQAIDKLVRAGKPFRGLFVGHGPKEYADQIRACQGCLVLPYVPVQDLPALYRAADVAVWPKQESTSQLDAAACGLPLILSNQVHLPERVQGNGLLFQEKNSDDLAEKLLSLTDPSLRRRMGEIGAARMKKDLSWDKIAKQYEADYLRALRKQ